MGAGAGLRYARSREHSIYTWDGEPIAYLVDDKVYTWDGRHVGWFQRGVLYDSDGRRLGLTREASRVGVQGQPGKAGERGKPGKAGRQAPMARPAFAQSDSKHDLVKYLRPR